MLKNLRNSVAVLAVIVTSSALFQSAAHAGNSWS